MAAAELYERMRRASAATSLRPWACFTPASTSNGEPSSPKPPWSSPMPRKNEWASRFGAARRATDKAYCAAAEAAIALEERGGLQPTKTSQQPPAAVSEDPRAAIARRFWPPCPLDREFY